MTERRLPEGLYLSEQKGAFDQYKIVMKVRETEKSYIFDLVEYESRYGESHIESLFKKSNRMVIRKINSGHAMKVWNDGSFTLYPFQAGIPFVFDLLSDKPNATSAKENSEKNDSSADMLWEMSGVICDEVFADKERECQEQIFCTIRTFTENKRYCPCCGAEMKENAEKKGV